MPDIVALGECMVELFSEVPLAQAKTFHKSYGGDTLNVLVAAARLGSSTGYITRVGDDPFASFLLESWRREGIDVSRVRVAPGFNGLYFISSLPGGQREFVYYRKGSAASTLSPGDVDSDYIGQARVLHVSAISQAISRSARLAVLEAVKAARARRVVVSYDPNLRLRLWSLGQARAALREVLPYVDILLPSAPDETGQLAGRTDPAEAIEHFWSQGIPTVVVKYGGQGCVVGAAGRIETFPAVSPRGVVDTTGAGDAFDGGLLHGIARGLGPPEAARIGIATSGLKVAGRGAVGSLPRWEEVERILAGYP